MKNKTPQYIKCSYRDKKKHTKEEKDAIKYYEKYINLMVNHGLVNFKTDDWHVITCGVGGNKK